MSIGLTEDEAHCALRFSLGVDNDEADIDYALKALGDVVRESQRSVRFVSCR